MTRNALLRHLDYPGRHKSGRMNRAGGLHMAEDGLPAIIYNILDLGLPLVHINALYAVREPDTCSAAVRVFFVIPLYFHAAALCTIVPELGITHVSALDTPCICTLMQISRKYRDLLLRLFRRPNLRSGCCYIIALYTSTHGLIHIYNNMMSRLD